MTFINGDGIRSYCVSNNIPYCDVDFYESYLKSSESYLKSRSIFNGVFVTHNGDREILPTAIAYAEHYGITHWYCQNLTFSHPRFIPIPIGIENSYWYKEIDKPKILYDASKIDILPSKKYYANFSIANNAQVRTSLANKIAGIEGLTNKISQHVTQTKESYQEYCEEILDHEYVFCPPGNGVDTHRFWETIILRRIPIVTNIEPYLSFSKMFKTQIDDVISSNNNYNAVYLKFWTDAILNKMSYNDIYEC